MNTCAMNSNKRRTFIKVKNEWSKGLHVCTCVPNNKKERYSLNKRTCNVHEHRKMETEDRTQSTHIYLTAQPPFTYVILQ